MDVYALLEDMGQKAKQAAREIGIAPTNIRNQALLTLADLIKSKENEILEANTKDLEIARAKNLDATKVNRLTLTLETIADMTAACVFVANLPDCLGAMESQWTEPNGLLIGKMRIPLGVIALIFESRPNVIIDSAILCLKAGNAVIMRGGSEALHSNLILANILEEALSKSSLSPYTAQVVCTTEREAIKAMCRLSQYIDVIIPRGGEALIKTVCAEATMPVLKHDKGVCHAYIDAGADLNSALNIVVNGKVQRPSACNALECVLVNKTEAENFLPALVNRLVPYHVSFKLCPEALQYIQTAGFNLEEINKKHVIKIEEAKEEDCGKEYLNLTLAIKIVPDLQSAIDYIAKYGSNHSEIICTQNYTNALRFLREVDASMVAVNASSRFNDGGQLGLGAEIGISTSKLHAYGPMGVKELTTTKFVVMGQGQIRE